MPVLVGRYLEWTQYDYIHGRKKLKKPPSLIN